MNAIAKIAEERIRRAVEEGLLDNLPNAGKPLNLSDDSWVPEDLRLVYKVLKNAGCLPPELELRKEILNLRELIDGIDEDKERLRRYRELNFKLMKLSMMLKRPLYLEEYDGRLTEKFT